MSQGNKIVPVRLTQEMLNEIEQAIFAANESPRVQRIRADYDTSSWIRKAIQEKLNHLRRSKKCRKPSTGQSPEQSVSSSATEIGPGSPASTSSAVDDATDSSQSIVGLIATFAEGLDRNKAN